MPTRLANSVDAEQLFEVIGIVDDPSPNDTITEVSPVAEELSEEFIDQRYSLASEKLGDFIRRYAYNKSVPAHWALTRDELEAESYLVIARLIRTYWNKPDDEFLKLCRTSIKNRVATLVYQHLVTSRKEGMYARSLSGETDSDDDDEYSDANWFLASGSGTSNIRNSISENIRLCIEDPAVVFGEEEELNEKYMIIPEFDRAVLICILGGNERLGIYLKLMQHRKKFVFKEGTVGINALAIARALCCPVPLVEKSFSRLEDILGSDILPKIR